MFNLNDYFDNINKSKGTKDIVSCAVCGDILFYNKSTSSLTDDFGWYRLDSKDFDKYICHQCLDHGYISENSAIIEDELNKKLYGSKYEEHGELRRFSRTWEEQQQWVQWNNRALELYLSINNKTLYKKFKKL